VVLLPVFGIVGEIFVTMTSFGCQTVFPVPLRVFLPPMRRTVDGRTANALTLMDYVACAGYAARMLEHQRTAGVLGVPAVGKGVGVLLAQLSRFAPDFRDIRLFSADKPLISLMCDAA
jgi:hypothetical protein